MHASAFQKVCNRFPMQIFKSNTPVHQHVRLKTSFLLEIFQISHQPEDRNRRDACGPCAAERATL